MAKIIRLMHAKLHRVRVTEANVNYVGSITIDRDLMEKVGILPLEEVDVINLNNGKRWSTYAIAGEASQGGICPNGGAALLCQPGDILIIIAYELRDRAEVMAQGHHAKVLVADEFNRCQEFIEQSLTPNGNNNLEFHSDQFSTI
ncbi:MAG: aspartate 1-decarboxylase [Pleurocapsa sp.]